MIVWLWQAIKVVKEKDLRIPENISIVGFDDIKTVSEINPPLTTVRQPLYGMGKESAKLLFNLLNNKKSKSQRILPDAQLIIRKSCREYKKDRIKTKKTIFN